VQVAALQLFLRSLVPALEAAGEARSAARWMDEACRALDPFRPLGLAEFTAFLARAEEYDRTGAVRVPGAADLRAEGLLAATGRLAGADDLHTAQASVARAVTELAREAGLKGSLTPDPKWAEAQAARRRVAPHLEAIRTLAGRITAPEAYADEAVRAEIARLEAELDRDTLKAVGSEFGVKTTAKSAPAKVLSAVLARLTGHQPPRAKRGAKAAAEPPDPAVVEANARRLAELIGRATDPEALSETDVDDELARLKALPKPALHDVVTRAGIEGVKPRDGVGPILTRVRSRLTATRRARERAAV
jgi:hypothetical protein